MSPMTTSNGSLPGTVQAAFSVSYTGEGGQAAAIAGFARAAAFTPAAFLPMAMVGLSSHALGFWMGSARATADLFAASTRALGGAASGLTALAPSARAETETPVPRLAKPVAVDAQPRPKPELGHAESVEPVPAAGPERPRIDHSAEAAMALQAAVAAVEPEDFIRPKRIEKPAKPDDLKMISGVGPKIEKQLNELGTYTFSQIAGWQAPEIAFVDDMLGFRGRIVRDRWIAQAAALALGGAPAATRAVDKERR